MLPAAPPSKSVLSVRPGDSGWFVYALQVALGELGYTIAADGEFGQQMLAAVKAFQAQRQLYPDGIAGPVTQSKIVSTLAELVEAQRSWLAHGYLRGITQAEASGQISVVNWSIPGGVDCGPVQRRVRETDGKFDKTALKLAFDVKRQLELTADQWHERRNAFIALAWAHGNEERAGRCAALAHNWPAGGEQMAKNGTVNNARQKADWVPRDANGVSIVRFPDGSLVETRGQWAAFYAIGGRHGQALVSRYVTEWR